MIEMNDRHIHCPKLDKFIQIFEDYEVIDGQKTLVRCSCPLYTGTDGRGGSCNGLNHHGDPCIYAHWSDT